MRKGVEINTKQYRTMYCSGGWPSREIVEISVSSVDAPNSFNPSYSSSFSLLHCSQKFSLAILMIFIQTFKQIMWQPLKVITPIKIIPHNSNCIVFEIWSHSTFFLLQIKGCHTKLKEKASDELAILAVIAGFIAFVEVRKDGERHQLLIAPLQTSSIATQI